MNTYPDFKMAQTFLAAVAGDSNITFQTYDDSPVKRGGLSKILHGRFLQHQQQLADLNDQGASVCFMVNRGDGKGRAGSNVQEIRAIFLDLDNAVPLGPVLMGPLKPHILVQSSPGNHHAYWLADGIALTDFSQLQRNVAKLFGGDEKVNDLGRVMRLPGFIHQKRDPVQTRIVSINCHPRYTRDQIADAFDITLLAPVPSKPDKPVVSNIINEGQRNETLFGLARGLVNKGFLEDQVRGRIQRVNAERCQPPLCATEVDSLVASACSHPPAGTINLPRVVFDSEAYRGLSHAGRTVAAMAYRRFNGTNNGNISLPFGDFRREFTRPQSFYEARREAIEAGVLRVTRKRRYHERGGREPDLFAVVMEPPSVPIPERSASN